MPWVEKRWCRFSTVCHGPTPRQITPRRCPRGSISSCPRRAAGLTHRSAHRDFHRAAGQVRQHFFGLGGASLSEGEAGSAHGGLERCLHGFGVGVLAGLDPD